MKRIRALTRERLRELRVAREQLRRLRAFADRLLALAERGARA